MERAYLLCALMAPAVCTALGFLVTSNIATPPQSLREGQVAAVVRRIWAPRWQLRPSSTGVSAGLGQGHWGGRHSRLENPRLPVPNEYLAGWALTQNDTACLQRFQDLGYTDGSELEPAHSEGPRSFRLWGEATMALMDRVDIVRDLDQRRLAASRYWQRSQQRNTPRATNNAGDAVDTGDEASAALSWADVNSVFESDDDFVRRESERYLEEAASYITSEGGWSADKVSRRWVASYRLSAFETRRQAQRFFAWGIPDERALDCILEPGKPVLEVGSGLGYWAYLLKLRSGDNSRVRCFDPFAPRAHRTDKAPSSRATSKPGMDAEDHRGDDGCAKSRSTPPSPKNINFRSSRPEMERPTSQHECEDDEEKDCEEVDDWFGEGRAPFTPAERGSSELIGLQDPDGKFRDWSILICWPSDGQWPAACLEEFLGDDFFYVGEAEGGATRMPWRLMRQGWELERRVAIPNWPGFRDALWWYRRKGAAPLPPDR